MCRRRFPLSLFLSCLAFLLLLSIIAAAILVVVASGPLAQGDGWLAPANVSNTEGSSYHPRIAVDAQDRLHMVWYEWVDLEVHWPYILYASKPADGEWTSYSYLPGNAQGSMPALAVGADGAVHVVWEGQGICYVRRDSSGTWSAVEDVSTFGSMPDVAVAPDGTVHVTWRHYVYPDDPEIRHCARSLGGGWSAPVSVYSGENASTPLIATDTQGTAHLLINATGQEVQAMYAFKPVGGGWSTPQEMWFAPLLESVEQLASDSQGKLHLAWRWQDVGSGQWGVNYASKALSQSWSGPRTIFSGYIDRIAIATDDKGLPHILWKTGSDLWYAFQPADDGWSSPSGADMSTGLLHFGEALSLAVDSFGVRHAVWDSGPVYEPPDEYERGEIWYTSLTGHLPVIASAVIPPEGGSLDAPGNRAQLDFPSGAVDQTTVVTYTETSSWATGELFGVCFFDLSAERVSDGVPVTSFSLSYTITVNYTDAEKGAAIESTLGLYWQDGANWVLVPTSSVDAANNRLTATADHMTLFAVLGETRRVYLPLVLRNR